MHMEFTEQVLFSDHSGGYREYRIPGIVCMEGAALFACEARAEDAGDWGDIDIIVLRVDGEQSPREVLRVGQSHLPKDGTMRTYNNPTLIPDGACVHLIYHLNYERVFIRTSPDGGCTWGEEREITDAYRQFDYDWNVCATGPGHGIQLRSGRLIAPVWLADGEQIGQTRRHWPSVAGCIYSDDHGKTWQAGLTTPQLDSGNETSVCELADGQVLFNIRNRGEERLRALAWSQDGGETAHTVRLAADLPDPRCFAGMIAAEDKVWFVNCGSQEKRVDLTLRESCDSGESWHVLQKLDEMAGYADMAHDGEHLHIFYERHSYEEDIIKQLVWKRSC